MTHLLSYRTIHLSSHLEPFSEFEIDLAVDDIHEVMLRVKSVVHRSLQIFLVVFYRVRSSESTHS
jgi:hypothetical protein